MAQFENVSDMTEFFTVANTITDGWLAYSLVITVWVVIFLTSIPWGRSRAITGASFSTGVLLLVLNIMGLVEYWVIVADLALLALGIFMMQQSKEG